MTPEQWIAKQIKDHGIKQSFIVEKAGIPDFTVQKLSLSVTGRRNLRAHEFIGICRVIGVNPFDCPMPDEGEIECA